MGIILSRIVDNKCLWCEGTGKYPIYLTCYLCSGTGYRYSLSILFFNKESIYLKTI